MKSALDLVGHFFLKMMLGGISRGQKQVRGGGGESTMYDTMILILTPFSMS